MVENFWWKTAAVEKIPLMEDTLQWRTKTTFDVINDYWCKMTFDERWILMEHDLWWKMTFDGRQPLMVDNLWCKTNFDARRPLRWCLREDDFWWRTTFDGRKPLMKDDLWWKITFDERYLWMEDDIWWCSVRCGIILIETLVFQIENILTVADSLIKISKKVTLLW